MGLLTTAARAAILSGVYEVSQIYSVLVPEAAGSATFETKEIHNGASAVRVTDHGSITRIAFNQTMLIPGKLVPGTYSFACGNEDNYFSLGADLWENGTTAYVAHPTECRVQRYAQIVKDGADNFISHSLYNGQINDIEFQDSGFDSSIVVLHCIQTEQGKLTDKVWDEDDYDELDLGIIFGGPVPGEN